MSQQTGSIAPLPDPERTRWFLRQILPHEPALRGWLSKRGTPGVDIDDVIQESYAVFASMDGYLAIRNPRAYLFQVAHSQVVRSIRRANVVSIQAAEELAGFELPDEAMTPEQKAIAHDELRRLAETIATMPEKTREAFVLRRVRGIPQREIAGRMGVSEGTVEKHIARGIRLLAQRFRDGGNRSPECSMGQDKESLRADATRDKPGY